MPEMPEVETIRRDLIKHIVGKRIAAVKIIKEQLVKSSLRQFKKILPGNTITNITRRGKLLIVHLKSGEFLLIHLKMTGQLIYQNKKTLVAGGHGELADVAHLPNKYSYIIFSFTDGGQLFFNDQRQFGYMKIADKAMLARVLSEYGIEPMSADFTLGRFSAVIKGKKSSIKSILLNQKNIAGIGNIYADEICFAAGILPNRGGYQLKIDEIKKLHRACQTVLAKAIKMRGTTFSDYRDASGRQGNFVRFLKVYGRAKAKCRRCRAAILQKGRVAGRGTVYCLVCQK